MIPSDHRSPIGLDKLLLVEGIGPMHFFEALLRSLGLSPSVEIRNFGGNPELNAFLSVLRVVMGIDRVGSLGVIRDAETDMKSAFSSVCSGLQRAGFEAPGDPCARSEGSPNVSVFILPNRRDPGMIEDLCREAVRDDPAMQCAEAYLDCLAGLSLPYAINRPKSVVRAYVASTPEPDLPFGLTAYKGYWPWDHPAFDSLKEFLHAL